MLTSLKFAACAVSALWLVHFISVVLPLTHLGIKPRSVDGLFGIVVAPLLHGSLAHLIANSTGLMVLGTLLLTLERQYAATITAVIWLLSGVAVWLAGSGRSVHIGSSGVVYGFIGFFVAYGFYSRKPLPMVVSIATLIVYGGAIWGVLPQNSRISWEAHLGGFVSGIALAAIRFRM